MADRITDKHLDGLCDHLNKLTGSPMKPWARDESTGRNRAQIGNYHISHAYGGVSLHRMSNESGGVSNPLYTGHVTKRSLYELMQAYIRGIESAQQ